MSAPDRTPYAVYHPSLTELPADFFEDDSVDELDTDSDADGGDTGGQ